MLKHIENKTQFEEAIKAQKKVLVDFFAVWCGPCNALSPILEDIASEHEEMDILKIDVDKVPDVAAQYGIQSIPTLILFEEGKAIDMRLGYMPKESVLRFAKL